MRRGTFCLPHPTIMRQTELDHINTRSLQVIVEVRTVEGYPLEIDTPPPLTRPH